MTKDEYQMRLRNAYMFAQLLMDIPVEEMLAMIGTAQAVGPIIDPTLYRSKADLMQQDQRMLRALATAKAELASLGVKAAGAVLEIPDQDGRTISVDMGRHDG
jgi:hypothetical protein